MGFEERPLDLMPLERWHNIMNELYWNLMGVAWGSVYLAKKLQKGNTYFSQKYLLSPSSLSVLIVFFIAPRIVFAS